MTTLEHADDWEGVGRKAVATLLDSALADLRSEAKLTVDDVHRGEAVTTDHVSRLRRTLHAVEYAVEGHLAVLADDAEPWAEASRDNPSADVPGSDQPESDE